MQRRQFLYLAPVAAGIGLLPIMGCGNSGTQWPDKPGPKVLVTFAPYYCFAGNVVGDKGTVKSLLSTQGPHHADTNIAERTLIEQADLLFINGLGLDDRFARKLRKDSMNRKLELINLGSKLDQKALLDMVEDGHDHAGHDHGDHDPHVWLSPTFAIRMVEAIRDELKKNAPQFATDYDANAAAYITKLQALKDEGNKQLADRKDRKLVTVHEALGYFAQSFNLKIAGVIQNTPGQEPNPTQLADLITKCKKENVRIIAVEPQYSSRGSADTLKRELVKAGIIDPQIIELDTLETATIADLTPDWYERHMRENLAELAKVMK